MMMGTQPGDASVSIKDLKIPKNAFSPPPIRTVSNGDGAHPARCSLIGYTGNKNKRRSGGTLFSYVIFIESADGSAQSFLRGVRGALCSEASSVLKYYL